MDKQIGDAIVSCDGTWQRHGFQSKNGVDTILSVNWLKCKVLDTIVLTNYCSICATKRKELKDVDKYKEWFETYKTECTKNYEESSGGMEPHGMLIGFRRSESLHKLNYTGYLGDGDSNVVSADPPVYPGKTVTKLECTGHIQKRMYNRCKKRHWQ